MTLETREGRDRPASNARPPTADEQRLQASARVRQRERGATDASVPSSGALLGSAAPLATEPRSAGAASAAMPMVLPPPPPGLPPPPPGPPPGVASGAAADMAVWVDTAAPLPPKPRRRDKWSL